MRVYIIAAVITYEAVITYSGNFQLHSPWTGTKQELQDNLSQDFSSIISTSTLENYYRGTRLHHSKGTEVYFSVDFHPDVTYLVEEKTPERLREFLQAELRSLVSQKDTVLDIIPDTVVLVEYIPSSTLSTTSISSSSSSSSQTPSSTSTSSSTSVSTPSSTTTSTSQSTSTTSTTTESTSTTTESTTSTTTETTSTTTETTSTTTETTTSTTTESTTSTTESTTTSTTESSTATVPVGCLELQFEPCMGLGYTHFSQPSFFGSETVELAIKDFYYLGNDSLQSGCTDDPTFFCAFAFPPCDAQSYQTLPCRDVCETTVERCVNHFPEPMGCEGYPTEPPCLKSPFLPVTTPAPTPQPDTCSPQTFERCRNHGFELTAFPTWFAENMTGNIAMFDKWAMPAVQSACHPDVEFFMCSAFFPQCDEEYDNITFPCRSLCEAVEMSCYDNGDILNLDCRMFETDPSLCILPPVGTTTTPLPTTTTPVVSTTPMEHQCLPISIDTCRHFGHVNGSVPSTWGAHDEATTLLYYYEYLQPVVSTGCVASALFYTCEMLFPSCDHGVYLYPCRSVCEEYNNQCWDKLGFLQQNCSYFDDYSENNSCLLPPAKPACKADEFSCEGAPVCVPSSSECDRKNDCGDWSDERHCECDADFEYKCGMGLCIRSYKRCDGETDCPDKSDEIGCQANCTHGQFRCDDGTCLMAEWVCDGQYDCPRVDDNDWFDEDEENCGTCIPYEEFTCTNGKCLPAAQRCDGTPQCSDHTDEKNCIMSGPPVFLNVAGEVMPICVENFTMDLAHSACRKLGKNGAVTWYQEPDYPFSSFFRASEAGLYTSIIGAGTIVDDCGSRAVSLECQPSECGDASYLDELVIGGFPASRGQIPWQASLQEFGKHFCGGSLIHPSFVLTAAHCVDKYVLNSQYLEVVLGTTDVRFGSHTQGKKTFFVKRIIIHPNHVIFQGNDIALVELDEPAVYSDIIKPLCLRQPGEVFTRASSCYIAGWGKMDPNSNQMASDLQVVKMTLWDTAKCNSSFAWNGELQSTEICAGYYAGIKAACKGDSGGALFCMDNDYTWRAVGVASYVHQGCNRPEKPVVFTDAVRYNDWIANNTVCQFECWNGRCLYDETMVCNKIDDCGDNSDEIDTCDISANCTFEDPYLCGYRSHWLTVTEALTANRYPLFDHTVGRYPGMFQLGAFRGKNLHTPRIDLTSPHCFRFRYHMRGQVEQGMAVSVHKLSEAGNWTTVWHRHQFEGPDRWLLGQFDLAAGHFDIVFSAYDNGMVSVDDMLLLPGKCAVQGCLNGEFACNTSGVWNCLPDALRCNTAIDCDTAEDETACPAASYMCDFENGLLCSLEQDAFDSTSGEWRLVNASRAGFDDVTMGDGTGHMLQIVTERLLATDYVYMGHDLHLGGHEHCLEFSYRSTSTARLEVNLYRSDETSSTLWSIENRQTAGWARTQVPVPADSESYLYYTVIGRELNRSVFHPMIALDDISITKGTCSEFTCPIGQSKCSSEAYCLDDSRFCDRVKDCQDFADEETCSCTAEEFKCPKGPCIPLEHTCDTIVHCPDGSDEGTICDSLRSTSCDFEDRFMCGYTHNGSLHDYAPYVWTREKNREIGMGINVATGPVYDHTFKNESGHWAFANGENGHPFDYVALESSPFSSTGNDILVFYYFAYSYFSEFGWLTGSLGLLVRNRESHTEDLSWFKVVDGNATWRSACVELPQSNSLTVSFVAMRGRAQKADLAVDDVKLLQITCDQFYLESRLQTGASTQQPHTGTTPPPGCPAGKKPCRNGLCIDDKNWCDKIPDCVDSSDEQDCEYT